jgi:hypothetical protein
VLSMDKILKLLKAVWTPKWVAVMHCWGHLKGEQQLFGETKRLIRKPSKQPSKKDKPWPHWQLPCSCPFIWMRSMAYFTRTGLVLDWQRKFSTIWMVEAYWWSHRHTWVTGSHIC